jgi:hypothetical protein
LRLRGLFLSIDRCLDYGVPGVHEKLRHYPLKLIRGHIENVAQLSAGTMLD